MPCYDSRDHEPSRESILESKMSSVLCGIVRNLGMGAIEQGLDWKEIGVTKSEFREWWNLHLARDNERRDREERIARRDELRRQAESKLTPEELEALKRG